MINLLCMRKGESKSNIVNLKKDYSLSNKKKQERYRRLDDGEVEEEEDGQWLTKAEYVVGRIWETVGVGARKE